jgi:hypothetical protein
VSAYKQEGLNSNPSPTKKKKKRKYIVSTYARRWSLTPVILATQEADVRRIMFQSQPARTNSLRNTLSQKKPSQKKSLVERLKRTAPA